MGARTPEELRELGLTAEGAGRLAEWEPSMPAILLAQTIGALILQVHTAGLSDGAGGVTLRVLHYDGPMTLVLSDHEARALIGQVEQRLGGVDAVAGC
jgi:hypothetical protein